MSCPHGHGPPDHCSSCLGVVARRVTLAEDHILIDGQPVRRNEDPMERRKYGRRGGRK